MIYEIQCKSDLLTGVSLTVTIPEEDLDRKALYTIQADKPGFILPFRYKSVDGQVELVYQAGSSCKLQYLAGSRTAGEYADLWAKVLRPLLDCRDWFMKPYSLVLDSGHIYTDKNSGTVYYIYIPSVRDCCGYEDLREMAAEISKMVTVDDANLENKVLRAIMKDFTPNGFMQMMKSYLADNHPPAFMQEQPEDTRGRSYEQSRKAPPGQYFEIAPEQPFKIGPCAPHGASPEHQCKTAAEKLPALVPPETRDPRIIIAKQDDNPQNENHLSPPGDATKKIPGEIFINIPINSSNNKKKAPGKKDGEKTRAGDTAEHKKTKKIGDFLGISKEAPQDSLPGVSAEKKPSEPQPLPAIIYEPIEDHTDDTEFYREEAVETGFRLIGNALLPPMIKIPINDGEVFTIGRYDAATGRKQSDFEFEKNTKAVSRRHAAIEHNAGSYSIVDLSSSAGTFVDGRKLPANTPYGLEHGAHVSFGNAGADYIWGI